jgi:hypothetical protein
MSDAPPPPEPDDRTRWVTVFSAARLYFASGLRNSWEDHQILSDYRQAIVEAVQAGTRVKWLPRSRRVVGTTGPLKADGTPDEAEAKWELIQERYGKLRSVRWTKARNPKAADEWEILRETMDRASSAYHHQLLLIKMEHDPADRISDYRLGPAQYREAVQACTCEHFPPMPPAPAWEGIPPEVEDAAHDHKCAARQKTTVDYGNMEVSAAMYDGPFVPGALDRQGDDSPAPALRLAATKIGIAWVSLSNGRIKGEAGRAEAIKCRDEAYIALGLYKSLLQYDRGLPRRPPGQPPPQLGTLPGLAARLGAEVEPRLRPGVYELSLTQNPEFRERFNRYVEALRRIKAVHDPDDQLHDYRTDNAYREAAARVIREYFPPRTTLLYLRDRLTEFRSMLRHRFNGPARGRTNADDVLSLSDTAALIAFAADDLNVPDAPLLRTPATLESLFRYSTDLLRACDRVTNAAPIEPLNGQMNGSGARVPAADDEHPDGTEAPDKFWWKNKRCDGLTDLEIELLKFFLDKPQAPVSDVMNRRGPVKAWQRRFARTRQNKNAISSRLSALNNKLLKANISITLNLKGDYIVKTMAGC